MLTQAERESVGAMRAVIDAADRLRAALPHDVSCAVADFSTCDCGGTTAIFDARIAYDAARGRGRATAPAEPA